MVDLSTGSVVRGPSPDGEEFQAYARRVLENMDEFEAKLEPVPAR